jgi:Flp pilus assembly pilin Flp
MHDRVELIQHLRGDTGGSTAIEYALIAGGISIFILGAINTLGANIMTVFYDKIGALF